MTDQPRLIEVAFPLRQASLDSVHEKNVRHGHISTLHIWPARRPLAACRAALIATLLPDPGNKEERDKLLERMAGKIVRKIKKEKKNGKTTEKVVEETEGGILHWGRESGPDLKWFREKIREAYGGRAPKVLDPFAGGGAIPLEAMRLGCEATAIDINPVAWFILKCTLEYPQKLAGKTWPLPEFAIKASPAEKGGKKGKRSKQEHAPLLADLKEQPHGDLALHIRAWGQWVLEKARADLERFYPVVDGKPSVAYLWARTVKCKGCRATIPLLKTRWLCKKDNKRVVLTMKHNADKTGVVFGIQNDAPAGTNAKGTMSRAGATCPCCGAVNEMEDIRLEGCAERLGAVMTVVVVDGCDGKEYHIPAASELRAATAAEQEVARVFAEIPFGLPEEPLPSKEALGFRVPLYGFDKWHKLFSARQLVALGTFVKYTRAARDEMKQSEYASEWIEAIGALLAAAVDRVANRASCQCIWNMKAQEIEQTFARFALPILWDYGESNPLEGASGGYTGCIDWVSRVCAHTSMAAVPDIQQHVFRGSATQGSLSGIDVIVTDPPYYDAIPYSDLMDFFYIWLRRSVIKLSPDVDFAFSEPLSPKWNHSENDGELIDDSSRHGGDADKSTASSEDGMARAFTVCHTALNPSGRLVIVFAHKQPDAWETLVSAIIRAGFVVDGSWPIQTERTGRMRANASAALSSSVWLVCKKRPATARPGFDQTVLKDMREKINTRLRDFWDAGIRGPDFVWAATGPAMEAYSQHPVVKKANEPGQVMTVSEFLRHVRRMVVDFVVGRVLTKDGGAETVSGMDDATTYYLLHRHDFGLDKAPVGACILYAISCNLSDRELADKYDILNTAKQQAEDDEEEGAEGDDEGGEEPSGKGSEVQLKPWHRRIRKTLGYEGPGGRPAPLIDQVHRLLHLWKAGEEAKVNEYLDEKGLRRHALFHQLLQALIELAPEGSEERALLEAISNHVVARGMSPKKDRELPLEDK
jgi:putative DNA methylase